MKKHEENEILRKKKGLAPMDFNGSLPDFMGELKSGNNKGNKGNNSSAYRSRSGGRIRANNRGRNNGRYRSDGPGRRGPPANKHKGGMVLSENSNEPNQDQQDEMLEIDINNESSNSQKQSMSPEQNLDDSPEQVDLLSDQEMSTGSKKVL